MELIRKTAPATRPRAPDGICKRTEYDRQSKRNNLTEWSRRDTLLRTGKNHITIQQGFDMTTKLPYIGYDKPLTESNSIFSYGERLENGTRSFMKIIKKNYNDRSKAVDTIIEVWQVDLIDLACTISDDPEWQEFMRNGQKMTA